MKAGGAGRRVLVIGGISWNTMIYLDRFPADQPGTIYARHFHATAGSTGAGKALNLGRLGLDVTLHGVLGEDEYGTKVREYFAGEPVRLVTDPDPAGTPRHVNLMNSSGERISIFLFNGTPEPTLDEGALEPLVAGSDLVVLNIANYARRLIPMIRRHSKPIWTDLHDYDGRQAFHADFIAAADMLQLTSNKLPDYRAFMEAMIADGKELVICTHGMEGATALGAEEGWVETPILPGYDMVDSNGAGDAYFSGVLYGRLRGLPLVTCMRLGAVASALCVTSLELASLELSPSRLALEYRRHFPMDEVGLAG